VLTPVAVFVLVAGGVCADQDAARKYSTSVTPAPTEACTPAERFNGTPGVARVGLLAEPVGAVMEIVGGREAAVTVTALETVVLLRSSVAIASIT